jgi:hypothetical protein
MKYLLVGLSGVILMVFFGMALAGPLPKACVWEGDCHNVKLCCYSDIDFGLLGRLPVLSRRGELKCAFQACAYSEVFPLRYDPLCNNLIPKCNILGCRAFACPFQ